MSPISLGLDLLLAVLLTAALMMGAKLNAKLKALRESHAGFAKAVGDLDAAGARAEAALAAIRSSADEAHDELLKRIETARALAVKLERASSEAQKALEAEAARPVSLAALASRPRTARTLAAADRAPTPAVPRGLPRSSVDEDLFAAHEAQRPRQLGGRRR